MVPVINKVKIMDNVLNYKEILVREPFYEVMPKGYKAQRKVYRGQKVSEPTDKLQMRILTQADFLRQYYPSGHKIMDPLLYPDIYKQDPDTKKWYLQPVMRTAFAFQKVIATKQIVHLVGNDIQFELSGKVESELKELQKQQRLNVLRQGWLDMNMEHVFYEAVESVKVTGDAAVVGYFDEDGKAQAKTFSFLNGDTLYPHTDPLTGKMILFARKYADIDENGNYSTENVEVWDDKYMYRARRGISKSPVIQKIKEVFGLAGYSIVSMEEHGFPFCPVAYYRERDGACWLPSQSTIETYEEAVSYFCENNKSYAFPIMMTRGDGVEFHPDDMTGAVKYIEIADKEGEAGFLNKPDVSEAFHTQLNILYDMIYEQSFGVKPPELKSGDLPGVAIKLLFSPAIELAIHDCQKMQPFLNDLVKIVKYGYGFQENCQASLANLCVNTWIEPYIHQNDSELMTNLQIGVTNGFLSKQTASERATKYAKNDEIKRIISEDIEKRKKDLQEKLDLDKAQTDQEIRKLKAQSQFKGQDVNTGKGNKNRQRTTDKWGNHPNENNWDDYNSTH